MDGHFCLHIPAATLMHAHSACAFSGTTPLITSQRSASCQRATLVLGLIAALKHI